MRIALSTPLKLILAATGVASIITLLRPEPTGLPVSMEAPAGRGGPARSVAHDMNMGPKRPWVRPRLPELEAPKTLPSSAAGTLPLPPPDAKANADTPPLPPLPPPGAPPQPDIVYLGRIVTDEKSRVFFATNGDPVVLNEGGVLNGNWRVEAISSTNVTLRNLHSGDTRVVAMGDDTHTHGAANNVVPVQIGPRFLGSPTAQITKQATD
jgi:hypothetical protein